VQGTHSSCGSQMSCSIPPPFLPEYEGNVRDSLSERYGPQSPFPLSLSLAKEGATCGREAALYGLMLSKRLLRDQKTSREAVFSDNEIKVLNARFCVLSIDASRNGTFVVGIFGGAENCILPGTVATVLNVWEPEGDIIMALNEMTSQMEIDFFRVLERDEIAELRLCGKYSIPEYGCSFSFGL